MRQRGEQRVLGERPDRPGAVHETRDLDLAAVGQRDLETRPAPPGGRDRPGVPDEAAGVGDRVQPARGLRGHPVPVDLPRASELVDGTGACRPRRGPATAARSPAGDRRSPRASRRSPRRSSRCGRPRRAAAPGGVPMRVMPGGGGTSGVVGNRCAAGTRSCRETVCRVRPGRSAAIATSTMVSPVPTSRRSPSGSSSVQGSATSALLSPAGAQSVPGEDPVASTTARATIGCPDERRTVNRSCVGRSRQRLPRGVPGGRCRGTPPRSAAGCGCSRRTPCAG